MRNFPQTHFHPHGRRADARCADQELGLVRGADPQQHQVERECHPHNGLQNVKHFSGNLVQTGDIRVRRREVHDRV